MAKKTILYVEDSSTLVNMVKYYFESEGYLVLSAENVDDAIAIINKLQKIDLFLLDIVLRGTHKTGYNLVKEIRSHDIYQDVPVIITSSRDAKRSEITALRAGASMFVPKPYDLDELYGHVEKLINESKKR
ncbi:MAG: response regulator [bacterium]|nr:response regulator [bacterium]